MAAEPNRLTDQPPTVAVANERERRVRDGLKCLQMSGALFLRAEMAAPWAYQSPPSEVLAKLLRAGDRRVVLFHVFTEGACNLSLGHDDAATSIRAGDVVMFPYAEQHRVGDPDYRKLFPLADHLPPPPWNELTALSFGGSGARCTMICGYLFCDDLPLNPVLASLPRMLHLRPEEGSVLFKWLTASIDYAMHAIANHRTEGDPLFQRLPELLFVECVCDYALRQSETERGWLAALSDEVLGRALAQMHSEPQEPWTLDTLAKRAGASRSVLDERFRTYLGVAPMSYLTAWRLQLASRKLRTTNASIAQIADAVGYGSEATFSRAFKRHTGSSPGQWRTASG